MTFTLQDAREILTPPIEREVSEAQLEILNDAHQTHGYASRRVEGGDLSFDAVKAEICAINVLFDACVECGMAIDHADMEGWAAARVTRWLVEA